jgi:hypothetical protein
MHELCAQASERAVGLLLHQWSCLHAATPARPARTNEFYDLHTSVQTADQPADYVYHTLQLCRIMTYTAGKQPRVCDVFIVKSSRTRRYRSALRSGDCSHRHPRQYDGMVGPTDLFMMNPIHCIPCIEHKASFKTRHSALYFLACPHGNMLV